MAKRKLFTELKEGIAAMGAQGQGKLTLRKVDAAAKTPRKTK